MYKNYHDYDQERDMILDYIKVSIGRILLSKDRTSKHPPYTWLEEDVDQHLLKAARHINTHMQIANGYQKDDGEDHLDNAITRLAMGIVKASKESSDKA